MFESGMFVYIFVGFLGLFFGSFLNVLADRLAQGQTILGRSKCVSCKHTLAWYDLIPIISFTLVRGKCRYCKASISYQYPMAELFTSAVFVLTYILSTHFYWQQYIQIIHIAIAAVLIVMFLSDIRYQIIPDEMQISLFILGVVRVMIMFSRGSMVTGFRDYGIAAVLVMLPLLAVFLFTKGKGMGFGDVKFAINMGLLLGIWGGMVALYLAFVSGGLIGAILLLTQKGTFKSKIAFGPFLIIATYLMMFYDNDIILILSRIYRFGP